jgi:type II secretory pathway pseudopilin PulG
MIVVAVIGLLAVIAVPKFASLVRKSSEAATKAALGSMRSALTIYHADTDGLHPNDHLECLTTNAKYLGHIPKCDLPPYHVVNTQLYNNTDLGGAGLQTADVGAWCYFNDPQYAGSGSRNVGEIWVGCLHNDTLNLPWSTH